MKRLLAASSCAVALALVVLGSAGCNANWGAYAARVDSTTITPGQLHSSLSDIKTSSYACVIKAETSGSFRMAGAGMNDGSFDSNFAAVVLTTLIDGAAARAQVAALHLPLPASARATAHTQVSSGLDQAATANPSCSTTGSKILDELGSLYGGSLVDYQLAKDALAAHLAGTDLTPASLQSYELRNPSASSLACTSVIEVSTQAKAVSIRASITRGASFATEAKQHSIDTSSSSNGGAIGCVLPSQLVQPVGSVVQHLSVGRVSPPVKFQSSWLLLLVTKRQLLPPEELISQIATAQQAGVQRLLDGWLRKADISISTAYGHWSSSAASGAGAVVPPSGPSSAFVPNPEGAVGTISPTPSTSPVGNGAPVGGTGASGTGTGGTGTG